MGFVCTDKCTRMGATRHSQNASLRKSTRSPELNWMACLRRLSQQSPNFLEANESGRHQKRWNIASVRHKHCSFSLLGAFLIINLVCLGRYSSPNNGMQSLLRPRHLGNSSNVKFGRGFISIKCSVIFSLALPCPNSQTIHIAQYTALSYLQ